MDRTKIIEVMIRSLKTTYTDDDKWLEDYENLWGSSVMVHPNYKFLTGDSFTLKSWLESLDLDWMKQGDKLLDLLKDIQKNGVKEPIEIYRDGRINSGHKRTAIALFLGHTSIMVKVIPDDTKL